MYEKIIFNKIGYVKLFPIFHASTAVFVYYPHVIHMYSTLNPHKIAELSTHKVSVLSEKNRQIASAFRQMLYTQFPEIVLLSACLSFFRTVFSSVIYRFDYNILISTSQGFSSDRIRQQLTQTGTAPAQKVSHKRTDRYSMPRETVPTVFPLLLRQTVSVSVQG